MFGQEQGREDAIPQRDSISLSLYFRFDDDALLRNYRGNQYSFQLMDSLFAVDNIHAVKAITIAGSSSPEGPAKYNERLSSKRVTALVGYLRWKYPHLLPQQMHSKIISNDGSMLEQAIQAHPKMPNREKVLDILQLKSPLNIRMAAIRTFSEASHLYIEKHILPYLRAAISCVVYSVPPLAISQLVVAKALDSTQALNSVPSATPDSMVVVADNIPPTIVQTPVLQVNKPLPVAKSYTYRPLFAIKTNLLFDAASVLNVEFEVPVGDRWSVAAEWIFPWWLWGDKQHCLQILSGNLEGRYWLGNRDKHAKLTGWFAGIYTGAGLYDLEWERKGYQGEFFLAAGASAGYAHSIGKNLRMEYALGIGYLSTQYHEYEAMFKNDNEWHLMRRKSGTFNWIGPTRLKVSLVWMPSFRFAKKGGGVQ